MAQVLRFDRARVGKVTKLPTGGIKADAVLSGPSVLEYRNPDGSTRKEYRPPETTFHADTLATIDGAPVTDEHPAGLVNSENYNSLAKGHVANPRRDADNLAATIFVQSQDLIDKIGEGQTEISLGYFAEVEERSGVTPHGERYDAVQVGYIVVNHVAVVQKARSKGARIRLDSDGNAQPEICAKVKTMDLDKLKAERDAALEKAGELQNKLDSLTAEHEALKGESDELKARADSLAAELPSKARELAGLIAVASKHDVEVRKDMDADAIRDALLAKVCPDVDFSEKSAEYKAARLDAALEAAPKGKTRAALHADRADNKPADPRPPWQVRADELEKEKQEQRRADARKTGARTFTLDDLRKR